MEAVIEVEVLGRQFWRQKSPALDGVSLVVPRGGVYGLVGNNGAGKTTLLKHLLGLHRAKQGRVRVFGLDPQREPMAVLARLGYLSEDRDLPGWMRVWELLRYMRAFYPKWDPAFADELCERFGLDQGTLVSNLSRGELAQAGLVCALAHRPELLVLDEPSSGLDPIVRRDILTAIIRTVAEEGRTVLFSSHLLDEVERVADRVAMLHDGKLVLEGTLETIKDTHYRATVYSPVGGDTSLPPWPGRVRAEGHGAERTVWFQGEVEAFRTALGATGSELRDVAPATLEEVFFLHAGKRPMAAEA